MKVGWKDKNQLKLLAEIFPLINKLNLSLSRNLTRKQDKSRHRKASSVSNQTIVHQDNQVSQTNSILKGSQLKNWKMSSRNNILEDKTENPLTNTKAEKGHKEMIISIESEMIGSEMIVLEMIDSKIIALPKTIGMIKTIDMTGTREIRNLDTRKKSEERIEIGQKTARRMIDMQIREISEDKTETFMIKTESLVGGEKIRIILKSESKVRDSPEISKNKIFPLKQQPNPIHLSQNGSLKRTVTKFLTLGQLTKPKKLLQLHLLLPLQPSLA